MKAKTIKAVIHKKIDNWLNSIEDETLRKLVSKNIIVTGGCIASMLLQEKVNDFDIYFRTKDVTYEIAKYYVKKFEPKQKAGINWDIHVIPYEDRVKVQIQSVGIASEEGTTKPYEYFGMTNNNEGTDYVSAVMDNPELIEDKYEETKSLLHDNDDNLPKYRPVFLTSNAITLSGHIQLILRFFGEPEEIHANYDYQHCTNYWTSWNNKLVLKPEALECLLTKELRYVGSKYPICSLVRMRKFIQRGWNINAGQIVKMVIQIGDLDLKDPKVLEDQLTGVDVAYFAEVISKVKESDPEKINSAYLIEIIDRLF